MWGTVGEDQMRKALASGRKTLGALVLMAVLVARGADANVVTVGPVGATGVDYNSIQTAINALSQVNPATDPDTNTYHTIILQAGTYERGREESVFRQHYRASGWPHDDGRGPIDGSRPHSKSLIVVNDVDEDFDGDGYTNSWLNGLHIIGAGSGRTIIDSKGLDAGTGGRVLFVKNDNVYIQGLTLRGARMAVVDDWAFWRGSGLLCHSANAVWKDIKVSDCDLSAGASQNCVNFRDASNIFLDGIEVTGYNGPGYAFYAVASENSTAPMSGFLANLNVHDNSSSGIGVFFDNNGWCVVFGALSHHNAGAGLYTGSMNYHSCYAVNCTLANNGGAGFGVGAYGYGWALNGIFSGNGASLADPLYFMQNLINETGFSFTGNLCDGYG
ncbi:MAG: hypothetical protein C0404_08025, partial [Verrucomicrobia bacterium]|nr:hypothetical protein [Verrucomicrobiota bacterium]